MKRHASISSPKVPVTPYGNRRMRNSQMSTWVSTRRIHGMNVKTMLRNVRATAEDGGEGEVDSFSTSFYEEIARRGMGEGGAGDAKLSAGDPESSANGNAKNKRSIPPAPRFARSAPGRRTDDDDDAFGMFSSFFNGEREASSTANEDVTQGQFERSRKLNSEGLDGLPSRASSLLQLGSTFFLSFAPLITIVLGGVGGLYYVRHHSDFAYFFFISTEDCAAYVRPVVTDGFHGLRLPSRRRCSHPNSRT